jgi:uncharacterized protein (TIGR03086 family)
MTSESLPLLTVALEQAADRLSRVRDDQLDQPTPCSEWTVAALVDHLVNTPLLFETLMRGEEPDWGAEPAHVGADREQAFRTAGDALVHAWGGADGPEQPSPLDWQLAELSVHTWDLATALGETTAGLDPQVAERGLAFMQDNLTSDNRGGVFAVERPAPEGADPYTRIAAFAGREV